MVAVGLVRDPNAVVVTSVRDAAVRTDFYRRERWDGTPIDDIEWSFSQLLQGCYAQVAATSQRRREIGTRLQARIGRDDLTDRAIEMVTVGRKTPSAG